MGQAKARGTKEQRVQAAIERKEKDDADADAVRAQRRTPSKRVAMLSAIMAGLLVNTGVLK